MKHSIQRDAVLNELCSRKDHPSAEEIYLSLKHGFPSLSLATVYRNLTQLEQDGKVLRISGEKSDRFDGTTCDHTHFICNICGAVIDVDLPVIKIPEIDFDGEILSHSLTLRGICPDCKNKK